MECGAGLPRTCAACGAEAPSQAKFCMACGTSFDAWTEKSAQRTASSDRPSIVTPKHIAERVLRDRDAMQGERKAVTVLFADIKGSTRLIQHEDPEEGGLILQTVLRTMIEAVHRFDGVVSKIMGDGLMALFGAPLALEDHAVRGSYAALAMRQAVRDKAAELRRARGIEVQVRIGLNSGEVVVLGIGTDLHMDYDAVGATVHLAARMEQTAPPDRIRITSNTADLVGNSMQLDPLGPIPVSGCQSRSNLTPDRRPILTPLSGGFWR